MRIASLRLENWECFRGTHELELEAKAYAVFARFEGDPERSNWAGKSSLLRAIRFALTGDHPHRLEDGWISRGEVDGSVVLSLDNGSEIIRSRAKGQRTTLHVSGGAKGEHAQELVYLWLGLSREDLDSTLWWGQGETARLVREKPAELTAMFSGWLGLGKLQEAATCNESSLAAMCNHAEAFRQEAERQEATTKDLLAGRTVAEVQAHMETCERLIAVSKERLTEAESRLQLQVQLAERRRQSEILAARAREFEELRVEVEKVDRVALDAEVVTFEAECRSAAERLVLARRAAGVSKALAVGGFDGRCPVLSGFQCPATKEINGKRGELAKSDESATREFRHASLLEGEARQRMEGAQAKQQEHARKRDKLRVLAKLLNASEASPPIVDTDGREKAVREKEAAHVQHAGHCERLGALTSLVQSLGEARRRAQDARGRLGEALARVATLREAALILGPRGAQRRLAQASLGDIERGANQRIAAAGLDLQVELQWEHEGKELAKACAACGSPFHASRAVKECARCGEPRGPHMVTRLEFDRSRVSGGADDFVGVALQLAGGEWLRRERGSGWGVGLLDEPASQMDGALRRALASMLRAEQGLEQMFVVGHHRGMLDALPGRITVVSDGQWAKLEVS